MFFGVLTACSALLLPALGKRLSAGGFGRTHLVPGQVDVSSFSWSAANKIAVRFWQVRPERALLIPVDAEVQNTTTHTHTDKV